MNFNQKLDSALNLLERDYKREYKLYHGTPKHVEERSSRNKARRKKGLKRGDPREVHHKRAMSDGGTNSDGNLAVTSDVDGQRAEGNEKKYN